MSAQPFRLDHGGLVDRSRAFLFRFDGASLRGHPGDTLASALLANGVRLVGRSFKYHRPRGILTAGIEEPNALVELRSDGRREPNTPATVAELFDGLDAASQNRWPTLRFDVLGLNGFLSPLLPAGFYYKTFMWPAAFWERVYEPLIRRAAGLGRAPDRPDPDSYDKGFLHCDVLVIGAGPAGLAATLAAGRAGARTILADQDFRLGGRLTAEREVWRDARGEGWLAATLAELESLPNVRLMPRTTIFGVYDSGMFGAVERLNDHVAIPPAYERRQRAWRIATRTSVLATGAIERIIAFPNNDLPGVMLAGAWRTYLNRFAVAPGRRVVVFTNGDDGWRTAFDALAAGLAVQAIVDVRERVPVERLVEAAQAGVPVLLRSRVVRVSGRRQVERALVATPQGDVSFACDAVAVSGGWSPTLHHTCHLGGRPVWRDDIAAFVPGDVPAGMTVAGAAAGEFTLAACLSGGADAGGRAAAAAGHALGRPLELPSTAPESAKLVPFWHVGGSAGAKSFVDMQNDVTAADVRLAAQEGYRAAEHMKRYTTQGMATDQGKVGNVVALAILAEARSETIAKVGVTTFRPPYAPVTVGALAGPYRGREFRPIRYSPAHAFSTEQNASFIESGLWLRAAYYPRDNESDWFAACNREVAAVRNAVGLCDVSTLGKIDVQGRDVGTFLDRIYTGTMSTLPVGKARYGLMLREDGFVFDDGTAARLGEEHFLVSTTTAHAAETLRHMEFCLQVLWPELDVQVASVSDQWAQFAIAGPRARDVLRCLVDRAFDVNDAALPYLAVRVVTVCNGTPARLFRLSFSGELGYEVAVPARAGAAFCRDAMRAGAPVGLTPYGLEALNVLRIEKGHVTHAELNGQTTARDLGFERMMARNKDFIGRTMAGRPALIAPDRPVLVGVKALDPQHRISAGAHFIPIGAEARIENDEGWVSSACFSPTLGHAIALGFLKNGRGRIGERVRVVDPLRDRDTEVEICLPPFFDPQGERLRG